MSDLLAPLLEEFISRKGTDLYLTVGSQPMMRGEDEHMLALHDVKLTEAIIREFISGLIDEDAVEEFDSTLEYNTAVHWQHKARFRVNAFKQRQHSGLVIRRLSTDIPTVSDLQLPEAYAKLALKKRGLVLIVGATGSGKSTSMAAMINHRNENVQGHIVTIEDPVEFIHEHKQCIITQRDVGIDTYSYGIALKNVLRQRPDVIVIGEIRDRDTMEHALKFSETGHLCIATLHAGNTNQALERIVSFFPEDKHQQVWLALSMNIRGIISQRLIVNRHDTRSLAYEIMLSEGHIRNLLRDGKITEIPGMIEKSQDMGMISFDQSLMQLVDSEEINSDIALTEADNAANIKLHLTKHDMNLRMGKDAIIPALVTEKPKSDF